MRKEDINLMKKAEYFVHYLRRDYSRARGKCLYYASKDFLAPIAFNERELELQEALLGLLRKATLEVTKVDSTIGSSNSWTLFSHPLI